MADAMSADQVAEKFLREEVVNVRVSTLSHKKAVQLERIQKYSSAKRAWGKDQKLIKYNILQVPNTRNYTVLLAMGRKPAEKKK